MMNKVILLDKFERTGVKEDSLELFMSYSSERKKHVSLNGQNSTLKNITKGVPQGKVWGLCYFWCI